MLFLLCFSRGAEEKASEAGPCGINLTIKELGRSSISRSWAFSKSSVKFLTCVFLDDLFFLVMLMRYVEPGGLCCLAG